MTTNSKRPVNGSPGAVVIATRLSDWFAEYFADRPGATTFVFDSGRAAFDAWRSTGADFFFCDYAGLADGMTGFRLIKMIRSAEPDPNAVDVYFMSEKPQFQEQLDLLKSLGVRDTVQKTPDAVERVVASGRKRIQRAQQEAALAEVTVNDERVAAIESLYHQFVGPVASRLIEIIRREHDNPAEDPRQYLERLAARIKTPAMRESFLQAVQRRISV